MPAEAIEFSSRETWASWLVDGIRIFDHGNREDRVLAFAPLTLDPDFGEAADLFPQLKSAVTAQQCCALKRASPLIRELKIALAPILSTSRTAAVLVAAREAVDDVSDFI